MNNDNQSQNLNLLLSNYPHYSNNINENQQNQLKINNIQLPAGTIITQNIAYPVLPIAYNTNTQPFIINQQVFLPNSLMQNQEKNEQILFQNNNIPQNYFLFPIKNNSNSFSSEKNEKNVNIDVNNNKKENKNELVKPKFLEKNEQKITNTTNSINNNIRISFPQIFLYNKSNSRIIF